MRTLSRRSLLKTAGVAAGAAAVSAAPALASPLDSTPIAVLPSGPLPEEAIVAIVRDPRLGEVTILSGTTERTYRDRALAKKLVRAAATNHQRRDPEQVA